MTAPVLDELLPCPFCGGPAVDVAFEWVSCGGDLDCIGRQIRAASSFEWNTRATPALAEAQRRSDADVRSLGYEPRMLQMAWREKPPLPGEIERWEYVAEAAVIDALVHEGVDAWHGDATSCVAQIIGAMGRRVIEAQRQVEELGRANTELANEAINEHRLKRAAEAERDRLRGAGQYALDNFVIAGGFALSPLRAALAPAAPEVQPLSAIEKAANLKAAFVEHDIPWPFDPDHLAARFIADLSASGCQNIPADVYSNMRGRGWFPAAVEPAGQSEEIVWTLDMALTALAQAYQVVGVLADYAGLFDNVDVQRALTNFSGDAGLFDPDLLPWPKENFSHDEQPDRLAALEAVADEARFVVSAINDAFLADLRAPKETE